MFLIFLLLAGILSTVSCSRAPSLFKTAHSFVINDSYTVFLLFVLVNLVLLNVIAIASHLRRPPRVSPPPTTTHPLRVDDHHLRLAILALLSYRQQHTEVAVPPTHHTSRLENERRMPGADGEEFEWPAVPLIARLGLLLSVALSMVVAGIGRSGHFICTVVKTLVRFLQLFPSALSIVFVVIRSTVFKSTSLALKVYALLDTLAKTLARFCLNTLRDVVAIPHHLRVKFILVVVSQGALFSLAFLRLGLSARNLTTKVGQRVFKLIALLVARFSLFLGRALRLASTSAVIKVRVLLASCNLLVRTLPISARHLATELLQQLVRPSQLLLSAGETALFLVGQPVLALIALINSARPLFQVKKWTVYGLPGLEVCSVEGIRCRLQGLGHDLAVVPPNQGSLKDQHRGRRLGSRDYGAPSAARVAERSRLPRLLRGPEELELAKCCFVEVPMLTYSSMQFYAAHLLLGLQEIHRRGVVHRDIKHDNLLISSSGNLLIADFGQAWMGAGRFMDTWRSKLERLGDAFPPLLPSPHTSFFPYDQAGTKGYMAPEVRGYMAPEAGLRDDEHAIVKSFYRGMLHKTPERRLSVAEMKAHPAGMPTSSLRARIENTENATNDITSAPTGPPSRPVVRFLEAQPPVALYDCLQLPAFVCDSGDFKSRNQSQSRLDDLLPTPPSTRIGSILVSI
ncbi:hypothetical protein B0H17DRAFT_1303100 [Mycena rosella]|uniref:non-specific serine/threonine protein kinase n=1 Tax=Mycena rosella TaxID=1033263 RepID=A0AAD7D9V1_MYCRO|nr:hypothetical protein B0H17DRAFT_1303100 [Mycena rosella]